MNLRRGVAPNQLIDTLALPGARWLSLRPEQVGETFDHGTMPGRRRSRSSSRREEEPVNDAPQHTAALATTDRVARLGRGLQWATIAWNGLEVFVTIGLGIAAGSLALIAFGLDSIVAVFA